MNSNNIFFRLIQYYQLFLIDIGFICSVVYVFEIQFIIGKFIKMSGLV